MSCKARSQGDQMYCPLCLITWDKDDPRPPACPEMEHKVKSNYYSDMWRAKRLNKAECDR